MSFSWAGHYSHIFVALNKCLSKHPDLLEQYKLLHHTVETSMPDHVNHDKTQ